MKQENHKRVAGLWIDHEKAVIISTPDHFPHGEYAAVGKVKAHHHAFHSSANENASNHQRRTEMSKYYGEVAASIHPYDEVLVFGPGKAQEQFVNHAREDKQLSKTRFEIASSGNLTDNQMIAQVRDHFKKYAF